MMSLPAPVSDEITSSYKEGNSYIFKSERGLLKISVIKENLINVCYSVSGEFSKKQPWILESELNFDNDVLTCSEHTDTFYYYINSGSVIVCISKKNGSVSYRTINKDKNTNTIFAEDEKFHREFQKVTEYITIDDDNIETLDVNTADGVKKIVAAANKHEGRTLYKSRLHLKFDDDEALFGLGQGEEGVFNLRGHVKYLFQGNRRISIPVIMSSKGYGLFFPSASAGMFCDNENGTFFQTEAAPMLEYYFMGGRNIDESVSMMRYLTGKAEMLPRWAYGYLQSKERYESAEDLISVSEEFRKRNIGIDALILDWLTWEDGMWGQKTLDPKRFPDPESMMSKLHDKDMKLMISIWPNMTAACENYKEFKDRKLLFPGTEVYNALSKEARDLYWKQVYDGIYCHGLDGFWCDSSEPFTPEWTSEIKPDIADNYKAFIKSATDSMPYDEINAYGFYHALGIYEGMKNKDKRVMNLTRNGYPGSQRLGTILWSGDIGASFDTLRKQVAEGLSMCVTGIPYWTLDIGAFFVKRGEPWFWEGEYPEGLDNLGYKELYVRWYQYGAFLPIFRSHGTDCPREPWQFGKPGDMFYDAIIKANELRYRLMPYIYSVAYKVWKEDYTMMRLLAFDFGSDKKVYDIYDQFMFGPSLMVCPVLNEMYYDKKSQSIEGKTQKTRKVYFPSECNWIDIRDNALYEGGTEAYVNADIYSIPVFARDGSVIPTCEGFTSTEGLENAEIIPVVYSDKDCSFEMYSDKGDGYGYQDGEGTVTVISYDSNTGCVTMKERKH